jgi:hypothetical protein
MAASATLALNAGVWFRRTRLVISLLSLGTACPLSGRNSTYRPVQISGTGFWRNFLRIPIGLTYPNKTRSGEQVWGQLQNELFPPVFAIDTLRRPLRPAHSIQCTPVCEVPGEVSMKNPTARWNGSDHDHREVPKTRDWH